MKKFKFKRAEGQVYNNNSEFFNVEGFEVSTNYYVTY